MSRKITVKEYYIKEGELNHKPCNIKFDKGSDKTALDFYLHQLQNLESLLTLTKLQAKHLNTNSFDQLNYVPVASMITVNFKNPGKVQVDKFFKEMKARLQHNINKSGEDRDLILNYLGVVELHDSKPLKPKPKVHHHFVITYCKSTTSQFAISSILKENKAPTGFKSMNRHYAKDSEGKIRLPQFSRRREKVLNNDGTHKEVRVANNAKGEMVYVKEYVDKGAAVYNMVKSTYRIMQHFSYLTKVYTKEKHNHKKELIPIPEIGNIRMLGNLAQLKAYLKSLGVELPKRLHSKQPRINAKKENIKS
jgi:hypothetical protein